MAKKQRQKFKYLDNEKTSEDEITALFITIKGISVKQLKQKFLENECPTLN